MVNKEALRSRKTLVEWIRVSTIKTIKEFYLKLLNKVVKSLESLEASSYKLLIESRDDYAITEDSGKIEDFFAVLKQIGFRVIYILDEFDNFSNLGQQEDFQLLLALSSDPQYKICLVTVSRRTIPEIENKNYGAISDFYGIFHDLRLGLFNENDVALYWDRLIAENIEISSDYKNKIDYLVGKHPFLMDLINYNVFQVAKRDSTREYENILEDTKSDIRLNLFKGFEIALKILKEEKLYPKAFQLVLGPVYDVTVVDEEKLIKYSFLKEVSFAEKDRIIGGGIGLKTHRGTSYVCFSDYLTEYWKIKMTETDFWALWRDTENNVRDLIKEYTKSNFGFVDWETRYLAKNPSAKREELINKLKLERDKYQKNFGSLASSHIVDYTYPMDLYELFISTDWNWFSNIFTGHDRKFWAKIFGELAFLRNPVAHNNSEFVPSERIDTAKTYCEIILKKIKDSVNFRSK